MKFHAKVSSQPILTACGESERTNTMRIACICVLRLFFGLFSLFQCCPMLCLCLDSSFSSFSKAINHFLYLYLKDWDFTHWINALCSKADFHIVRPAKQREYNETEILFSICCNTVSKASTYKQQAHTLNSNISHEIWWTLWMKLMRSLVLA